MLKRKGFIQVYFAVVFTVFTFPYQLFAQLPSVELKPADLKKAQEYKQQVSKYQQLNNDYEQAKYINLLGSLYWTNNSPKEAAEYFKQSISLNEKIGNKNGIKTLNNYLGIIYSEAGDYNSALEYFRNCLKIDRANSKKLK